MREQVLFKNQNLKKQSKKMSLYSMKKRERIAMKISVIRMLRKCCKICGMLMKTMI